MTRSASNAGAGPQYYVRLPWLLQGTQHSADVWVRKGLILKSVGESVGSQGQVTGASLTYHLVPRDVWQRYRTQATYVPESFGGDGFIHTTNDLEALLDVANTFYRSDTRPYLVLVLDLGVVGVDVRHDDPSGLYPHLYGPLNVDAVVGYLVALRAPDGRFVGFENQAGSETPRSDAW